MNKLKEYALLAVIIFYAVLGILLASYGAQEAKNATPELKAVIVTGIVACFIGFYGFLVMARDYARAREEAARLDAKQQYFLHQLEADMLNNTYEREFYLQRDQADNELIERMQVAMRA